MTQKQLPKLKTAGLTTSGKRLVVSRGAGAETRRRLQSGAKGAWHGHGRAQRMSRCRERPIFKETPMPSYTNPLAGRGSHSQGLRSELGAYIKLLRTDRGMTQTDLARAVGIEYYTAISAIEVGRNVVPPERYLAFARALGVDPKVFATKMLQMTNPWLSVLIFSSNPEPEIEELNSKFPERTSSKIGN
jgi:transcriptional regulator with XRE-family HTH domain